MAMNTTIKAALITAAGVIIAAIIGKVGYDFWQGSHQYTGRVINKVGQPLQRAKVTVEEDQGVGEIHDTDSEGKFTLFLKDTSKATLVRLSADGYQEVSRHISPNGRTGVETFTLEPVPPPKETAPAQDPARATIPEGSTVAAAVAAVMKGVASYDLKCDPAFKSAKMKYVELKGQTPTDLLEQIPLNLLPNAKVKFQILVKKLEGGNVYEISCTR